MTTTKESLRDLFVWITGADGKGSWKSGNPYMHKPVTAAILALTHGKSKLDYPAARPKSKIDGALWDLVQLAVGNSGSRGGNPYMKPEVRAASVALGGDGYDVPAPMASSERKRKR